MSDEEHAATQLASSRARWLELQEELLRGVTHALSNRIATVSAAAYMLEHEDMSCQDAALQLRVETERMDRLLQLLRLLPSRDDSSVEPVAPLDIVEQSLALHAQHSELRDVTVRLAAPDDVLPVLVEPHALLQAMLLALTAAKRAAFAQGCDVVVSATSEADVVTLLVYPENAGLDTDAAQTTRDAEAANMSVRSALGSARARDDGGCVIALPTLSAARRAGR